MGDARTVLILGAILIGLVAVTRQPLLGVVILPVMAALFAGALERWFGWTPALDRPRRRSRREHRGRQAQPATESAVATQPTLSSERTDVRMLLTAVGGLAMLGLLMTWAARASLSGDPFSDGTGDIPLALAYIAAGTVLALLLRRLGAEHLEQLAGPLVVVSLAILAAADQHLIGFESGARAWLRIGDFVIEPAEIVALTVVVFAAKRLATAGFSRRLEFDPTILLFLSGVPFLLLTLTRPSAPRWWWRAS
jgi:hypothetical protein